MRLAFDQFELDEERKRVIGPDGPINLRPQTFAVLRHLIAQAPAVVGRDQLLDAVWGHQATSDSSLAQTIKELRQALGDSSSDPRLIVTRRRLGYQFVAEVRPMPLDAAPPVPPAPSAAPKTPALPTKARPIGLWPLAAVLVLGLAVMLGRQYGNNPPAGGQQHPPTLAIAGMVNASDDPELDWLGPALETHLGHALIELGGFRVLALDRTSPGEEARPSGVDYLIEGVYQGGAGGDEARLQASLRRPGSSEIVTRLELGHAGMDVAALSMAMAAAIRDRLGLAAPRDADGAAVRALLPRQPDAQRAYFAALDALDALDAEAALEHLRQARKHEPGHPRLDHLEARALKLRGDLPAARAASERALTASALWPRRDRLEFEATAAALDFDYELAAERLQTLTHLYPEPRTGRRLVDALIRSGRLHAARTALDSLHLHQPDDARLWLLEADLAAAEHDHPARLAAAEHARADAGNRNWPEVQAASLLAAAQAHADLGDLPPADHALATLATLQPGDALQGQAALAQARLRLQQGELSSALAVAGEAEAIFQALPAPLALAETHLVTGAIHEQAGRVTAALTSLQAAMSGFQTIGDRRRLAHAAVTLATTLVRHGQSEQAIAHLHQAARHFRETGDRQGEGVALLNHATILAREGRLNDAGPLFERAHESFVDADDLHGQATALASLAGLAGDRRDMRRSIDLAEQSLALFQRLDAQIDMARVSYNLGLVHRRRGDLLSAKQHIRQAADAFAGHGATLMQARALTTLGAILIGMGRHEEFGVLLTHIQALEIEAPAELSVVSTIRGEHALATGDLSAARAHFQQAKTLMETVGAENHLLVSRLNLARLDLAEGAPVHAEQAARDLAFAFAEIRAVNRRVDALLLLGQALIDQQRDTEAANALAEADDLLTQSPDAEQTLRLALLLRSRIAAPELAQERLLWVERTADAQGFRPLMQQARELRLRHN